MCAIPPMDMKFANILSANITDPTVSFMKSGQAINGTLTILQVPALTYRVTSSFVCSTRLQDSIIG